MSSKIGTILSIVFVTIFFIFGLDMISIQFIYSELDAKASSISYYISKTGYLDEDVIKELSRTYQVAFTCLNNCSPAFGDVVDFLIQVKHRPIIISQYEMTLSVRRTTVIGYYG